MATAAVIGASGGIGRSLVRAMKESQRFEQVLSLSRHSGADIVIDLENERIVKSAAEEVAQISSPLTCCIVATGILHQNASVPEKSLAQFDPDWAERNFRVNSIGPMLVAKHFLPLMPRKQRFVFAAVSARVGSISDNRLGGWHSYRASKAALNMMIRNAAIEYQRRNDASVIVALHPGTVDTGLSEPFQANVPKDKLFTPEYSAKAMLSVLDSLEGTDSGKIFSWDGAEILP